MQIRYEIKFLKHLLHMPVLAAMWMRTLIKGAELWSQPALFPSCFCDLCKSLSSLCLGFLICQVRVILLRTK